MFVRYFCQISHKSGTDKFGDMGFDYFLALKEADIPVRVIPTTMGHVHVDGSRWSPFNDEFMAAVPDRFMNVVCGNNGELVRLYTVGVKNVAITCSCDEDIEVASLKEYDAVICPSRTDRDGLVSEGVQALHIEAGSVAKFLKTFV